MLLLKQYALPKKMRSELKKPLGKTLDTETLLKKIRKNKKLVSVGDFSTNVLLSNGVEPQLAIYDGMIMRKKADKKVKEKIRDWEAEEKSCENPPGAITVELQKKIVSSLENGSKTKIYVKGEEDLAVLPCLMYAPNGAQIVYGQPKKGIVLVEVSPAKKKAAEKLLEKMEVVLR